MLLNADVLPPGPVDAVLSLLGSALDPSASLLCLYHGCFPNPSCRCPRRTCEAGSLGVLRACPLSPTLP